jgi:hypothetical protein
MNSVKSSFVKYFNLGLGCVYNYTLNVAVDNNLSKNIYFIKDL